MTQTSIKCHPKKKAPTVIDPEERWIQLFPIHLRKEEFFFNKWLICSISHHEMLHQLLARQKSPPMTIHLQSKIQADQSWILLFERFCENLLKTRNLLLFDHTFAIEDSGRSIMNSSIWTVLWKFAQNTKSSIIWKIQNFFYNTVMEYRYVMLQPQPEFFPLFRNDEFPIMVLKLSMQEVMLGYLSSGCDTSSQCIWSKLIKGHRSDLRKTGGDKVTSIC